MTVSGDRITTIDITDYSISEVLRVFIKCRSPRDEEALAAALQTTPYQALSPERKSAILAWLCNELLTGKCLQSEIERNIDKMAVLRKDKWEIDNEVRKCVQRDVTLSTTETNVSVP